MPVLPCAHRRRQQHQPSLPKLWEKLGIPLAQLKPSWLTFHGIVPRHSCTPMGRVQLELLFGRKGNSHREPIWFEVVDISSPYHALLG
jgi:hypothetical protein